MFMRFGLWRVGRGRSRENHLDIVGGGRVVTTIGNQDVVGATDDKLVEKLRGLSEDTTGKSGGELAQELARQIADLLGGRVVKSDTALQRKAGRLGEACFSLVLSTDVDGPASICCNTDIHDVVKLHIVLNERGPQSRIRAYFLLRGENVRLGRV